MRKKSALECPNLEDLVGVSAVSSIASFLPILFASCAFRTLGFLPQICTHLFMTF